MSTIRKTLRHNPIGLPILMTALATLIPTVKSPAQSNDAVSPNVRLSSIAVVHKLHGRGAGWKAEGSYPAFRASTPLTAAANKRLRSDCLKYYAAFVADAKSNAGSSGTLPSDPYEFDDDPYVTLYEPNHLISTATFTYDFEDGAHGMDTLSCITFGQVGAKARVVTLGDFFRPGIDYHKLVSALLLAKLKKIDGADFAQDGSMGPITNDQYNNFSVFPDGMEWHFNPYEAGPFSSGIIDVKLTWAELGPGLNKAILP